MGGDQPWWRVRRAVSASNHTDFQTWEIRLGSTWAPVRAFFEYTVCLRFEAFCTRAVQAWANRTEPVPGEFLAPFVPVWNRRLHLISPGVP